MAMFLQLLVYSRLGERGIAARRKLRTEEIDSFADLDLFRQVGRLQAHADAVFELLALRAGIDPENQTSPPLRGRTPSTVVVLPAPLGPRSPKTSLRGLQSRCV